VKEDDASSNALYFKVHVDPLSDASTEEYFAAFELYEGDKERLGPTAPSERMPQGIPTKVPIILICILRVRSLPHREPRSFTRIHIGGSNALLCSRYNIFRAVMI
jgi:hypothetical protein